MNFSKQKLVLSLFLIVIVSAVPAFAFKAGDKAPDFKLKSIAGEEVSLSEFKGQAVILKLATTWCPTCKQLSGEIEQAGKTLKKHNVAFLEVFVQDSEKMIRKYLKGSEFPMTFHALLDDGQAYKAYNVYLIPRFLLIDADQLVQFDSAGQNVWAHEIISMVKKYAPLPLEKTQETPAKE